MALIKRLTAIGDAIRNKTGKQETMTLDDMVQEINDIDVGGGGNSDISPINFKVSLDEGDIYTTDSFSFKYYFPIKNPSRLVLKTISIGGRKYSASDLGCSFKVDIYGLSSSGSNKLIKTCSEAITGTSTERHITQNEEIDLNGCSLNYLLIAKPYFTSSKLTTLIRVSIYAEFDLYL